MESALCWYLSLFATIGICPLVTGAPAKCSDKNVDIKGGSYTLTNHFNEGSILRYGCDVGYFPYPTKKRECDSGNWNPPPSKKREECKKITCPNPNVLDNGAVEPYKPQYFVGDVTTYRCHSDYTFRGSPLRVCQPNGKWNGSTPICSRDSDHCPDPGTPPGTSRTGHIFNIDDTVSYRCDNKLMLLGSKKRVCQDNGQWSGREPECYADYTYDTPEEVAEAFGSTLKTTLTTHEIKDQQGKRIRVDQEGDLNIYIALDASDSIDEEDFNKAKQIIRKLLEKISFYEVSPNYEIIVFATEATRIVSIADFERKDKKKLFEIFKKLKAYDYDEKGQKSGTNIAKAFETILDSMSLEKARNETNFYEIRHVIIMFTDGIVNMGGNPSHKINEIKQLVYNGDEAKREEYLDIYMFGVGDEVEREDLDAWVTKRPDEDHLFILRDIEKVEKMFDDMIDEGTSVGLCGLYRSEEDRLEYPWLIKFTVTREDASPSNCLGSLVTPSFILTAAHCFKFGDLPESISLEIPLGKDLKEIVAKQFMIHPGYKPKSHQAEGISEYYIYDVALIELQKSIKTENVLRPICIPCTKETSGALKLPSSDVTCSQHRKTLLKNNLVKAFFMSSKLKEEKLPKNDVQIKLRQKEDVCIDDTKNTFNISHERAKQLLEGNFLCTGGEDDGVEAVTCKGDSGGALFLQQTYRSFQVGVVSWGLKDLCNVEELETGRDFHVDLFNKEVRDFLKMYLEDGKRGAPLHFLD